MPGAATTPQNVIIFGNVIFNADYTFAPGSNIVVASQVSLTVQTTRKLEVLTGSTIKGCTNMWDGIFVANGGRLVMKGVTVEDAFRGVFMNTFTTSALNSSLSLTNCTFNACWNGVTLGSSGFLAEATTSTINTTTGGFAFNKFNGGGVLKTNTFGVFRCHTGVHVNSVRPITFITNEFKDYGIDDLSDPIVNSDFGKPIGFLVVNSSPFLVNAKFSNIGVFSQLPVNVFSVSPAVRVSNPVSQTLNMVGGFSTNVGCAVFSKQFGNISIGSHTVTNSIGGIFCSQSPLTPPTPVTISVTGCTFNGYRDFATHFSFNHPKIAEIKVSGCTFNDNNLLCAGSYFPLPGRTAISLTSPGNVIDKANVKISSNTINNLDKSFCGGYSSFGVDITNLNDGLIETNTFNDQQVSSAFNFNSFTGVRLDNAQRYRIWSNDFLGTAASFGLAGKQSIGTEFLESGNNSVNCNDFNFLTKGMRFKGENCDNQSLVFNNLNTHTDGLFMEEDAIVGKQEKGENRWFGSAGQTEANYNLVGFDPTNALQFARVQMSEFKINDPVTTSVLWASPRSIGGNNDNDNIWFVPAPLLPPPGPIACLSSTTGGNGPTEPQDPKDPIKTLSDGDIKVLNGTFPPYKGYESSVMDAKFRTYSKLDLTPSLLVSGASNATIANTFIGANSSTSLGNLYAAFKKTANFGQATGTTATNMASQTTTIAAILNQIKGIDEQMAETTITPATELSLLNQRAVLYTQLDQQRTALDQTSSTLSVAEQQAAAAQLSALNNLVLSTVWENTLRSVLAVSLSQQSTGLAPTNAQIETIRTVANSCRYANGYGVVLARTMYKAYDTDTQGAAARYASADNTCTTVKGEGRSQLESPQTDIMVRLTPNPAHDQCSIWVSNIPEKARYQMVDFAGRIVKSGAINSYETLVQTSDIPAGLYIVNITGENTPVQNIKVLVTH
jgi:hypothetical protein